MSILRIIIKRKQEPIIRKIKKLFRIGLKRYKDTGILYRTDEEFSFLEKYSSWVKIENSDRIQYVYKNRKRFYYPDFYCPDFNMIVEVREIRSYWKNVEKNNCKKDACIENGYNYLMILGSNYDEFEKIIRK